MKLKEKLRTGHRPSTRSAHPQRIDSVWFMKTQSEEGNAAAKLKWSVWSSFQRKSQFWIRLVEKMLISSLTKANYECSLIVFSSQYIFSAHR